MPTTDKMPGWGNRKPISLAVQTSVLVKSRRRCCVCYGIDRDTGLKSGQIAHIDQNSKNNKEDNLVFLCLNHHDQYDSRTRQSKNFTEAEVRHFRCELIRDIQNAFDQPKFFGLAKTDVVTGVEGLYTRIEGSSAEILITALPTSSGRFHVMGFALWSESNEFGPNTGELDFSANLIKDKLEFADSPHNPDYNVTITISENVVIVGEESIGSTYGMGVAFGGIYKKQT